MTANVHRVDGLTAPIAADSPVGVHYEVLHVDTQIKLHHSFGFQSSGYEAPHRSAARRPTRAEFFARMRAAAKLYPAPAMTPGAEAQLARETEEWASLRREATSAMLGDD